MTRNNHEVNGKLSKFISSDLFDINRVGVVAVLSDLGGVITPEQLNMLPENFTILAPNETDTGEPMPSTPYLYVDPVADTWNEETQKTRIAHGLAQVLTGEKAGVRITRERASAMTPRELEIMTAWKIPVTEGRVASGD